MPYIIYKKRKNTPTWKDFSYVRTVKTKVERDKKKSKLLAKGYRVRTQKVLRETVIKKGR